MNVHTCRTVIGAHIHYYGVYCAGDYVCTSGCCTNSSTGQLDTDTRCIPKTKKCSENWNCESNCCSIKNKSS